MFIHPCEDEMQYSASQNQVFLFRRFDNAALKLSGIFIF